MEQILPYAVEFAIRTVLILAGLWIMIAVQKLPNHILGLIGTAALASVLEMVLDPWLDMYFSTLIIILVLDVCIWKVTSSSSPFDIDVIFTVAVGGALTFAMNIFLIGALMGELRLSPSDNSEEAAPEMVEEKDEPPGIVVTSTNQVTTVSSNTAIVKPVSSNAAAVKPAVPKKAVGKPEKPSNLNDATRNSIKLKGLNSGGQPSAILSDGKRTFTLNLGESRSLSTADGMVVVKLVRVTADDAVVSLNGELLTLTLW